MHSISSFVIDALKKKSVISVYHAHLLQYRISEVSKVKCYFGK